MNQLGKHRAQPVVRVRSAKESIAGVIVHLEHRRIHQIRNSKQTVGSLTDALMWLNPDINAVPLRDLQEFSKSVFHYLEAFLIVQPFRPDAFVSSQDLYTHCCRKTRGSLQVRHAYLRPHQWAMCGKRRGMNTVPVQNVLHLQGVVVHRKGMKIASLTQQLTT